eukprot:scaffold1868_cov193-Cylindrotheca_fusiformis.AAC.17
MISRSTTRYALNLCLVFILIVFVCNGLRSIPYRDSSDYHLRNRPIAGAIRGSTPYIESSKPTDGQLCKTSSSLSLWLMPSDKAKREIQREINYYAEEGNGPAFRPHVTVVGGIPCGSEDHIKDVIERLQQGLAGFGEIPTSFHENASNFPDTWNQALVVEMQLTPRFVKLCRKSRQILGMEAETEKAMFPPPVEAPHLSLYYGTSNIPDAMDVPPIPDFEATTLSLWITDPPTLEGVPKWKQLGTIDLL